MFGTGASSLSETVTPQTVATPIAATTTNAQPTAPDLNELIRQAGQDFNDYQRLTSQGRLAEAGQKLDDLKRVLGELNSRAK
jgi:hypothetical protein